MKKQIPFYPNIAETKLNFGHFQGIGYLIITTGYMRMIQNVIQASGSGFAMPLGFFMPYRGVITSLNINTTFDSFAQKDYTAVFKVFINDVEQTELTITQTGIVPDGELVLQRILNINSGVSFVPGDVINVKCETSDGGSPVHFYSVNLTIGHLTVNLFME